jgi:hypothetical protein
LFPLGIEDSEPQNLVLSTKFSFRALLYRGKIKRKIWPADQKNCVPLGASSALEILLAWHFHVKKCIELLSMLFDSH